ncbi:2405_t:CDS:2, partial [Ambispora gerdemannii]
PPSSTPQSQSVPPSSTPQSQSVHLSSTPQSQSATSLPPTASAQQLLVDSLRLYREKNHLTVQLDEGVIPLTANEMNELVEAACAREMKEELVAIVTAMEEELIA